MNNYNYDEENSLTTHTILVVDDLFQNRLILKKVIDKISSKTLEAENGLEAIRYFYSINKEIDLIITDIEMPVMNGIEMIKKLRLKSSIPIIATSGNGSQKIVNRVYEVGANAFLHKPFNVRKLPNKILSLIKQTSLNFV